MLRGQTLLSRACGRQSGPGDRRLQGRSPLEPQQPEGVEFPSISRALTRPAHYRSSRINSQRSPARLRRVSFSNGPGYMMATRQLFVLLSFQIVVQFGIEDIGN